MKTILLSTLPSSYSLTAMDSDDEDDDSLLLELYDEEINYDESRST
jgi:hypothetical protein